jgi:hypothetical protein
MSRPNTTASEPTNYTVRQKAREEGTKLRYDAMKHLTTLSTGSILILVAFLEKLFTSPKWKALIATAFISFVLTIIASYMAMLQFATLVSALEKIRGDSPIFRTYIMSLIFFLIGIISLVIFALRNLV